MKKIIVACIVIIAVGVVYGAIMSNFTTEENLSHNRGTEWSETSETDSVAVLTLTHAAVTGVRHKIMWCSFRADTLVTVSILNGSTTLYKLEADSGEAVNVLFPVPLISTAGNTVSLVLTAGDTITGDFFANFGGFSDRSY